jgi:PhnB protein
MPTLVPYLTFDGNCAEAMRFYEKVLNGKLEALITNGQSPVAAELPPGNEDKIMHAALTFDRGELYAGDFVPGMGSDKFGGMHGFSITLNYTDNAQAEKVFNAFAEGGKVTMPFQPTFWAEKFGMVTDRYGTPWIVNGKRLDFRP